MAKYYFFKKFLETNAQGEIRTVIRPLPGQTNFDSWYEGYCSEVDATLKVQLPAAQNGVACRATRGTIFGVKYEGRGPRSLKLSIHRRGEENFYRCERRLFLVIGGISSRDTIGLADDEMMAEYRRLGTANHWPMTGTVGAHAPEPVEDAPSVETAHEEPVQETRTVPQTEPAEVYYRENREELSQIESHLLEELGEQEALLKLHVISLIRDRMKAGVADFEFVKQNGDERRAIGTRRSDIIAAGGGSAYVDRRGNQGSPNDGGHFVYWDLQKRDWRCFCTEDVLSVNEAFCMRSAEAALRYAEQNAQA